MSSALFFFVSLVCLCLAGKPVQQPESAYQTQMTFFVPEFNYTEYRYDFGQGLFRWDTYGSDNITTEIIKNQTQEHYIWFMSYDKKLLACGDIAFNASDVPVRWSSNQQIGVAHIPEPVTGYSLGQGMSVWVDKKGMAHQYVNSDQYVVDVLEIYPFKTGNYFSLPQSCDPSNLTRYNTPSPTNTNVLGGCGYPPHFGGIGGSW